MSVNISNDLAEISDIKVIAYVNRMGPRQQIAFKRMLTTGIYTRTGLPQSFAVQLREKYELPSLTFTDQEINWRGAMPDVVWEALNAGWYAAQLEQSEQKPNSYTQKYMERIRNDIDNRALNSGMTQNAPCYVRVLKTKKIVLPVWDRPMPDRLVLAPNGRVINFDF